MSRHALRCHTASCHRIWETEGFRELCHRCIRNDRRVIDLGFCDDSVSQFVAFCADFSQSVFVLDENGTSARYVIRQGWNRAVHPHLLDGWKLPDDVTARCISDDGAQKVCVHGAEVMGRGILLSVTTGERRKWKRVALCDHLGHDFVYDHFQFQGDALLVTGTKQQSSGVRHCVAVFYEISSRDAAFPMGSLKGSDGRLADDGSVVITWNGSVDDTEEEKRAVYIYDVKNKSEGLPDASSSQHDDLREADLRSSLSLEEYDDLREATILDVYMLHERRTTRLSDQSSTEELFPYTRLTLLCDMRSAGRAKIVLMDLERRAIDSQIDVSASCLRSAPPLTDGGAERRRTFSISPDKQRLLLCDVDKGEGVVYSLVDGKELGTMDYGAADDLAQMRIKFDPLGKFVAVAGREKIQIFAMPQSMELNGGDDFAGDAIGLSMRVLRFAERYDRIGFGHCMSAGYAFRQQLVAKARSLMETGVFSSTQRLLQSLHYASDVSHVIVDAQSQTIAIVSWETHAKICIYRKETPSDSSSVSFLHWNTVDFPDLVTTTTSANESFGTFCTIDEEKAFAFASSNAYGICIARLSLACVDDPITQWIESRTGVPLRKMKVTEDAAKVFAIFEDWEFLVFDITDGIRVVSEGYLHYPCAIHFFVGFFIESSFIHISEDNRSLSVGWDSSRNRLVSFILDLSREDMIADYVRNYCHLRGSNFEWVLWMNRDHSRVMVHRNEHGSSLLIIYDMTCEFVA